MKITRMYKGDAGQNRSPAKHLFLNEGGRPKTANTLR